MPSAVEQACPRNAPPREGATLTGCEMGSPHHFMLFLASNGGLPFPLEKQDQSLRFDEGGQARAVFYLPHLSSMRFFWFLYQFIRIYIKN
jgi:hypothetical protein